MKLASNVLLLPVVNLKYNRTCCPNSVSVLWEWVLSELLSWLGVLVSSKRASSVHACGWGQLHMSLLYDLLSSPALAYRST